MTATPSPPPLSRPFESVNVDQEKAAPSSGAGAELEAEPTHTDFPHARKALRKVDVLLLPLLTICYGLQFYDKAVLGSASIFGILTDLSLSVTSTVVLPSGATSTFTSLARYSLATSAFYYGYMAGVLPTAFLAQRLRLSRFLGAAIFVWGAILLLTPAISTWQGLVAQRFFLGLVESSASPGFVLVTRAWYARDEVPLRLGVWYAATGLFSVFSGLVNYGIGVHAGAGTGGIATWKKLFFVPGALTVAFGVAVLLLLPPSPAEEPLLRIRGYNVFSEQERRLILDKVQRPHARSARTAPPPPSPSPSPWTWDWRQVGEGILDVKIWLMMLMAAAIYVTNGGVTVFGPILIKSLGNSSTRAILLQTPGGAVTVLAVVLAAWLCSTARLPLRRPAQQHRGFLTLLGLASCLPVLLGAALIWGAGAHTSPSSSASSARNRTALAGYYLLASFGAPYIVLLALLASNIAGRSKATLAAGAVFVGYNAGNIASSYILVQDPGQTQHLYPTTWKIITAMMLLTMALFVALAGIWAWENRKRERRAERAGAGAVVDAEGKQEEEEVAADLTDGQDKAFRYVY